MYKYMSPEQAYLNRRDLIGRPTAYAYWLRWDDTMRGAAEIYSYRFRKLLGVIPGPHAYTLILNGWNEPLITYDNVCVYYVELAKSS